MRQLPAEISEAIRLQKELKSSESHKLLHDYLISKSNAFDALLWLAKVTDNPQEAMDAAELAYFLCPENDIALRAVATVGNTLPGDDARKIELDLLKLTGMTESQARAVNWPFKGFNRPLGVLMDEKAIDLRDLAWAADHAYDAVIQQASRTLLLLAIFKNRVKDVPKPVTLIEGYDNAGYHERMASVKAGVYLGIMICITVLMFVLPLANQFFNFTSSSAIGIISLFGMVAALFLVNPIKHATDEVVNYRVGREGERKTLDLLRASFYYPWTLIHNFEWPNRKWGDADIILVGPGGIWCFEVKSFSNQVRVIGHKWQYRSRFGWRTMKKNPANQAQRTAMRVKDYLESFDIRIRWVQPVVIWAGDEKNLSLEDPVVPVWTLSDIENKLEDFWRQQRLNEEQIAQISKVLGDSIKKAEAKK